MRDKESDKIVNDLTEKHDLFLLIFCTNIDVLN